MESLLVSALGRGRSPRGGSRPYETPLCAFRQGGQETGKEAALSGVALFPCLAGWGQAPGLLLAEAKGPSWGYLVDFSLAGGKTPLPGQVKADGGNPLQAHQPFWLGAELLRGVKEVSP